MTTLPATFNKVQSASRREAVTAFIVACGTELTARDLFRADPTPANMTAWTTAKNLLEDRKMQL